MAGVKGTREEGKKMNQEIANFFVKFTTDGLKDVKQGIEDINKNIDGLKDSFEKSETKGESFFGALVKWTTLVGGLTAAFQLLRNTIKSVFDVAYEVVDLYKQEQLLGVQASVLEKYGLISQRNMGSQADAYAFFRDVKGLMGRYELGKVTDEDNYLLNMLGVNWSYNKGLDPAQNRDRYLNALHNAVKNIDPNDEAKMGLLSQLIKQESMRTFFMSNDEQFQKQLAWGDKWRVLSKDENALGNAQKAITVEMEWEQTLKEFRLTALPILTELLVALRPVIDVLRTNVLPKFEKWIEENKDNFADWVTQGIEWLLNDFPQILSDIYTVLSAIAGLLVPIVKWVGEKLWGTGEAVWEGLKAMWYSISGDEAGVDRSMENLINMAEAGGGGYVGDLLRVLKGGFAPRTPMITETSTRTITTNHYGANVKIAGGTTFREPTEIRPDGTLIYGTRQTKPNFITVEH